MYIPERSINQKYIILEKVAFVYQRVEISFLSNSCVAE